MNDRMDGWSDEMDKRVEGMVDGLILELIEGDKEGWNR